ncbi:amine oxidase, partial [Vararia minispora EC-137]
LILDSLRIPFKVIEARERVGGRLYTHTFRNHTGAPYNYFDVGAMRFPEIRAMTRVFHLFRYPPLNTEGFALRKKLKEFYFANGNALYSYNGVTMRQSDGIVDNVIEPFASRLLEDLEKGGKKGWEYMIQRDHLSTRAYMSGEYRPSATLPIPKTALSVDVINWMETFDSSTGSYDRALTETVLAAISFGWKRENTVKETKWWCIDGGAFEIANTMYQYLRGNEANFSFSQRVTGIKVAKNAKDEAIGVDVTTNYYTTERFSHVITSIPLPVLRSLDLVGADLTPLQSNALRQLNYGASTKIGMQFRTAWWTTAKDRNGRVLGIVGGQTYTDSPLRTIVYPSYGDAQGGRTTTLIASYCWTDDAERLGALIGSDRRVLEEMMLRELARIHNVDVEFLAGQLIDTFAWSWSHDPFSMGAFASFGPGKFANVYQSLTTPAARGRLHFAGEAISTRHAWVEGALDSAWRAVYELLCQPGYYKYQKEFFRKWGTNAEWFGDWTPLSDEGTEMSQPPPWENNAPKDAEEIDPEKLNRHSLLLLHIAASESSPDFIATLSTA